MLLLQWISYFLFILILFYPPPHFLVYELKFVSQNQVSIGSMKWKSLDCWLQISNSWLVTLQRFCSFIFYFVSPPPPLILWCMNSNFSANIRSPWTAWSRSSDCMLLLLAADFKLLIWNVAKKPFTGKSALTCMYSDVKSNSDITTELCHSAASARSWWKPVLPVWI